VGPHGALPVRPIPAIAHVELERLPFDAEAELSAHKVEGRSGQRSPFCQGSDRSYCPVVVVLEKSALAGIVEPACRKLDTPLLAARDYSSATPFYEVAKEWICPGLEEDQDAVVLHLGDHDASGLDMTREGIGCRYTPGRAWMCGVWR
jgi:hypothetical protein